MALPPLTIAQAIARGNNNFTLVRLLAAAAVIVSHAHLLTTGDPAGEPFLASTGFTLGQHAVSVFFGVSGFLVMASWDRRQDVASFLAARALRVFPALLVTIALMTLVVGPALLGQNPLTYVTDAKTREYLFLTLVLFDGRAVLPGAFDQLPVPGHATATVWTLKYELACYVGLAIFGALGLASRRWLVAMVALLGLALALLIAAFPTAAEFHPAVHHTIRFAACFWLGMAAWRFRDVVPVDWRLILLIGALAAAFSRTPFFEPLIYLAEVYGALVVAFTALPLVIAELDIDLSYGLYLYGWAVEQCVIVFAPALPVTAHIALALLITAIVAAASWYFVERPAIKAKSAVASMLTLGAGSSNISNRRAG